MGKTIFKLTGENKEKLKELAIKGYMDTEIAKQLNVSRSAIQYWRKKLNIKTQFTYDKISKIDNEKFEILFKEGLSDYKIAKILNMSPDGIYSHRMRHGYIRKKDLRLNESIPLTQFQKSVLIGTVLGDSSLRLPKNCKNPRLICMHGIKQKNYCEYKTKIFETIGAKCRYHKRNIIDKRTNIYYEDYTLSIPANPELLFYYNNFYKDNKKIISQYILDKFDEISLAFMFMDDGYRQQNTYRIATNCFNLEDLKRFQKFLYKKWNIQSTICKDHTIYIKTKSSKIFENLISPYICESMRYKLNTVS